VLSTHAAARRLDMQPRHWPCLHGEQATDMRESRSAQHDQGGRGKEAQPQRPELLQDTQVPVPGGEHVPPLSCPQCTARNALERHPPRWRAGRRRLRWRQSRGRTVDTPTRDGKRSGLCQCSTWVLRRDKERKNDETHQVCDIAAQNIGRAVRVPSREVHDAQ
jgi:hypothetical protein